MTQATSADYNYACVGVGVSFLVGCGGFRKTGTGEGGSGVAQRENLQISDLQRFSPL